MKLIITFVFSGYLSIISGILSNIIVVRMYGLDFYGKFAYSVLLLQIIDPFMNELTRSVLKEDNKFKTGLYTNILAISLIYYTLISLVFLTNALLSLIVILISLNNFLLKIIDNENKQNITIKLSIFQPIFILIIILFLFFNDISSEFIYLNFLLVMYIIFLIIKLYIYKSLPKNNYYFNVKPKYIYKQILFIKHRFIDLLSGNFRDKTFHILFAKIFGLEAYGFYNIINNIFNLIKKLLPSIFYKFESVLKTQYKYFMNIILIKNSYILIFLYSIFILLLFYNINIIKLIYKIENFNEVYLMIFFITSLTALVSFSSVIQSIVQEFLDDYNAIIKIAITRIVFFLILLPFVFIYKYQFTLLYINLISILIVFIMYNYYNKNIRIILALIISISILIFQYYIYLKL